MARHLDFKQREAQSCADTKKQRGHKHTRAAANSLRVSLIPSAMCAVYVCFSAIKARLFLARPTRPRRLGVALTGFRSMGVCGLSSGRPCPFARRVWQAWADRWPPLSIPLQSNTVTGFSSAVDLATASQQSRLALGLLNRRVMKSSAAHMIIKALTLGGLSEAPSPHPPPPRALPLSAVGAAKVRRG